MKKAREGSGMRQPHFERGSRRTVIRRQPGRLLALTGLGLVFVALFASAATPAPATHFVISGTPTNTIAGDFLSLTVTAYDGEIVDTGYTGTVQFTSSDAGGQTVLPADYQFQAEDNGTHTFTDETKLTTTGSQTVTASEGAIEGTSDSITVDPGDLASFAWTKQPTDPQKAGEPFNEVEATAYDAFGNVKTDYTGSSAVFSGLDEEGSPNGDPPAYGFGTWTDGASSSTTVTDYLTETTRLKVEDGEFNTVSEEFTVTPGPLGSLTITDPTETVTAGDDFDVTVAAFDQYGNAGADGYWNSTGCVIFSGPDNSPDIAAAPLPNTAPLYPALGDCSNTPSGQSELNFDASGQATANITLYNASTTTILTVEDATETYGDSTGSFPVNNGTAAALDFTTEPPKWVAKSPANFSAAVTVYDTWGNTVPTQDVTVSLQDNPGGATLTCPANVTQCTVVSGNDGVAPFTLRLSQDGLGYKLKATSSGATDALSNAFNAADQLGPCNAQGNCTVKGDNTGDEGTNLTSASVTGAASGSQLAMSVDATVTIPTTVCGSSANLGVGTEFEAVANNVGSVDKPVWTITATLKKKTPGFDPSRGASKFDICLGTVNITPNPSPPLLDGCSTTNPGLYKSWPNKIVPGDTTPCADQVGGSGKYWGIVPDAPPKVKTCSLSATPTPVVLSKSKTGAGDLKAVFCAAYPFDGGGGWR